MTGMASECSIIFEGPKVDLEAKGGQKFESDGGLKGFEDHATIGAILDSFDHPDGDVGALAIKSMPSIGVKESGRDHGEGFASVTNADHDDVSCNGMKQQSNADNGIKEQTRSDPTDEEEKEVTELLERELGFQNGQDHPASAVVQEEKLEENDIVAAGIGHREELESDPKEGMPHAALGETIQHAELESESNVEIKEDPDQDAVMEQGDEEKQELKSLVAETKQLESPIELVEEPEAVPPFSEVDGSHEPKAVCGEGEVEIAIVAPEANGGEKSGSVEIEGEEELKDLATCNGIKQQIQTRLGSGFKEDGDLCEDESNKQPLLKKGDFCEENGDAETPKEDEKVELGLENGYSHFDESISAVEIVEEEKQEIDHPEELESDVDASEPAVGERTREAELESDVELEEGHKCETVVMETDHQNESEPAVEDNQELKASIEETNRLESAIELADKHEARMAFTDPEIQREPESVVELEVKVDSQDGIKSVDVEGTIETEIMIPDANGHLESQTEELKEEEEVLLAITRFDERAELEPAVEDNLELKASVEETNRLESAIELADEHEARMSLTDPEIQRESESVVELEVKVDSHDGTKSVDVEGTIETVIMIPDANGHLESQTDELKEEEEVLLTITRFDERAELEPAVEDNQELKASVEETNRLESAIELADEHEARMAFTDPEIQRESESVVELEVKVDSHNGTKSVGVEGTIETEIMIPDANGHLESQTNELKEEQKVLLTITRFDERAELEPAEMEEKHNLRGVGETDEQEESESLHVEEKQETFEVVVTETDGLEVLKSLLVVEEKQQPEMQMKATYDQAELKQADEIELVQEPSIEVVDREVMEVEDQEPKNVVDEMKLNSEVHVGESITSSVEGDRSTDKDDDEEATPKEVGASDRIQTPPPPREPIGLDLGGERSEPDSTKRQQFYLVKVPKFDTDDFATKIQNAEFLLNEKTRIRDSIVLETRKQQAIKDECHKISTAAMEIERSVRAAVGAKGREIASVQLKINKMKDASLIHEYDDEIHKLAHRIEHETAASVAVEIQNMREMKQLKHRREELSSTMGPREEIPEAHQKDKAEEQLKVLKKEYDTLRIDKLRAENDVKAAFKKCTYEKQVLEDLKRQYKVADDLRRVAYGHFQELKKKRYEKTKHFYKYKDDQTIAAGYASSRDREALQSHCNKQVESVMELWNKNEEFRQQYVKSNANSTVKRLRTLDGRSLAPGEESPALRRFIDPRSSNLHVPCTGGSSVLDPQGKEESSESAKPKASTTPRGIVEPTDPTNTEAIEEEVKLTKVDEEQARMGEELARKEEELRKTKADIESKERLRIEQRAKAKEAEERKRRKADKAQAKAEYKAQKEAELREKKKAKKEKKKVGLTNEEGDSISIETETNPEIVVATASKRSATAVKQHSKIQPLPLPLRNRGKRKMQTWMWVLLTALLALTLFFVFVPFSFGF